ncbi:hypothetical protein FH968_22200, partial [Buttiauxella sp. B2]|uniref:hypothetical protein n=1 Tax=Buttiauxella sp. B2 TaxID=2587812 RepID=UPI00111FFD33
MSQNSTDRNTLSVNLLASLAATDNQFDPTPAAPGVVNIDTVKDDVGQKTGVIGNEGLTDDLTPTLGGFVDGGAGIVISIYANTE